MIVVLYTGGLPFTGDTLDARPLGGSESAFISLARALAALGHEVHAHCHCTRPGTFDGVQYHSHDAVVRWSQEPCDLFICSRFFQVLAIRPRARRRLLWMHDCLSPDWAAELRPLLAQLDGIFCLSRFHAAQVLSVLPEARALLRLTNNGVDLDLVARSTAGAVKRHRVLFTSRAERGLTRALDLYAALGDRTLEFVYCSYPPLPDAEVQRIERRCRVRMDALAADGFPVRTASYPKAALYRTIAESEAVIYPCGFAEIFCISALEAQACGTAYLTVDAYALPEVMAYPGVAPDDPGAFLAALRALLGDPDLRRRRERRGLEHAAGYGWAMVAARFADEA